MSIKRIRTLIAVVGVLAAAGLACWIVGRSLPGEEPPAAEPAASLQPVDCHDDSCLDACLARIAEVLPAQSFDPLSEVYAGNDGSMSLVVYGVNEGQLSEPVVLYVPDDFKSYQEDFAAQLRVWDFTYALLPADHRKWITSYKIFTDGPGNILAWAGPDDAEHWALGVDIVDSGEPLYLTETLVHEIGHLVTLNAEQIPLSGYYYGWYQHPTICSEFLAPDGCTLPDSYINRFYQRFWLDFYDEWLDQVVKPQPGSPEESQALVDEFYSAHRESFVRDYAATNIFEDIAETFTEFVLKAKPDGSTPVEEKMLFFYDFPQMVSMRLEMIQSICGYLQ